MLAAATAWSGLAAELHAVGAGYQSAISELTGGWAGASAASMAAATQPYVTWMFTAAGAAELTAIRAKAAAAAYETAFAMTVPPPVIAANRSLQLSLLATNVLGQNTAAIATTEAHYLEMWAQDATAMYGYASSAAAASTLTPFTEAPQTTNPAGSAGQSAAVAQAAAGAAGSQAQNAVTQLAAVPNALQTLTAPVASDPAALLTALAPSLAADPSLAMAAAGLASSLFGTFVIDSAGTFGIDAIGTFGIDVLGVELIETAEGLVPPLFMPFVTSSTAPVMAGLGEAASVGALSVPQAWTVAAPLAIQNLSATTAMGALPAVAAGETAIPFAEMATAGVAGRALAGVVGRGRGAAGGLTGKQRAATPKPPAASRVQSIGADLRELAELRDAGLLTEEEFIEEKRRLLGPTQ